MEVRDIMGDVAEIGEGGETHAFPETQAVLALQHVALALSKAAGVVTAHDLRAAQHGEGLKRWSPNIKRGQTTDGQHLRVGYGKVPPQIDVPAREVKVAPDPSIGHREAQLVEAAGTGINDVIPPVPGCRHAYLDERASIASRELAAGEDPSCLDFRHLLLDV